MEEFQLSKFTKKGSILLEDVRQEFKNLKLDDSALPKIFSDEDSALKLVFIGQYASGKSSIIKMLTGEELAIGADITTQNAQTYLWNGLEIIDTPGIHTELRPDHDKLTYEQINHAALLIFVITNEGFSQRIGNHFRNLAIEQKRASNMVLVVNKMDKTALGNVPEQQEIISADLEKVIQPYSPQDLFLSFVSTDNYFESLGETDEEIKSELMELSGHDKFVENLNKFVSSHELLAKISKPLYTIAEIIRNNINLNIADNDNDVISFLKTVEHKKNLLREGKRQCLRDVQDLATACRNEIVTQGRAAANMIQPENDKDTIENSIRDAQLKVEEIVNTYNKKIEDCLSESMSNIGNEIDVYNDTDFVKQINIKINNRIKIEQQSAGNKAVGGALVGLGGLIAKFANPAAVAVGTPTAFAIFAGQGVKIGAGVLLKGELGPFAGLIAQPLGKFVQKILTPPPTFWQRMGAMFARNAGNIGKAFGAAGAAVAIAMEVRDANKAQENERKLQEQRENIMKNFDDVADEIFRSINDNVKKWTAVNIDKIISECNDAIQSINTGKEQSKLINTKLNQLLKRTESLIEEIQNID